MSGRRRIIWIDDNPGRKSTAVDLGALFINVKDKNVSDEIAALVQRPAPQLVVIDHVLDKTSESTHPFFQRGSTIAEAIKEKWPSCGVVGVTAADKLVEIDLRTKGTYDALFPIQNFAKYFRRINGIADGFSLVARGSYESQRLVRLLKPPKDEAKRLLEALPDDLKKPSQDASVASRLYGWVNHLMDRPGFLFDALWSATFLGLNESGFEKVRPKLVKAIYAGLFSRPDEPHWWSTRLAEILYTQSRPRTNELSWHAGRRLPGIQKRHFSVCYRCKEEFPETVAFPDEASTERHAMHLRCTMLHPLYKRELYCEDIRIMRGE